MPCRRIALLLLVVFSAASLGQAIRPRLPASIEGLSEYRRDLLAYFRATPGQADTVILGDSLVEYGPWAALGILNRGIGGDTSADVLARVDEVIGRAPRQVFIMVGTNDQLYGISPAQTAQNIALAARRLNERRVSVIVFSILPVSATEHTRSNARIEAANHEIGRYARDYRVVDLWSLYSRRGSLDPSMTSDGVHLTPNGYAPWVRVLRSVIANR
jgi:lysophospholipase L1-like esterase